MAGEDIHMKDTERDTQITLNKERKRYPIFTFINIFWFVGKNWQSV